MSPSVPCCARLAAQPVRLGCAMTGKRPITYWYDVSGGNLPGQDRYRELAQRDLLAKAIAIKKAGATISPAGMSARARSL